MGKDPNQQGFEAQAKDRASLLLPRKDTVRSLLQRPEHAAIFRLHAVAEEFFAPLRDMLGEDKEFLLGTEEPTEVDCLAYGFLSLMLFPEVPQAWLAKTMRDKHGNLARFVERMHKKLKLATKVEDVMDLAHCVTQENVTGRRKARSMSLPGVRQQNPRFLRRSAGSRRSLLSRFPTSRARLPWCTCTTFAALWKEHLPTIVLGTIASIALGSYYAIQTGLLVWPHGEHVQIFGRKRFADYGHLGAALSGIGLLGQQMALEGPPHQQTEVDVSPVEVDVTVRGRVESERIRSPLPFTTHSCPRLAKTRLE